MFLVREELAKQYGPVVGLKLGGDKFVLCSDYESVKHVFTSEKCDGKPGGLVFKMRTYGEQLGLCIFIPN
jgi:methyl farnesoate epoxidase / farnesoate epoxidase